jgi:imidazolonepropionase-like amidohydrolase
MEHTMRRLALVLPALVVGLALPLAVPAAANAEPHVYAGVTVLDPERETATPNSFIVVDGGRIVSIGTGPAPASVPAERRHDFSGKFVLPGFIDTHAHMVLGPISVSAPDGKPRLVTAYDPAIVAHNGRMLLAYGVTTVRDPGGDTARTVAYRDAVRRGEILGPEALVAGLVIERSPTPFDGLLDAPTPERPVAAIVRDQARAGVDYVKLYAHLHEPDIAQAIRAAKVARVRTVGHLEGITFTRAAELGIDALVHMIPVHPDLLPADRRANYSKTTRHGAFSFFEWYEAADLDAPEIKQMIAALAKHRVHVDATLIAFHLCFWGDDPAVRDADAALAHPAMLANWRGTFRFDFGWKPDDYRRAKAVWPKVLRLTRMMYEAGVPMTLGTDMNNPFVVPGISLSREMRLHADAGIPNWAILRMATTDAARILGLGNRTGRIKPGLDADLVFLDANPAEDIANAARVSAVVHNGRLLTGAELKPGTAP